MNTYYNFIHDHEALNRFLKILPPLKKDDVWMLILCARTKYLAPGEKKKYALKDTLVVERKIVRENGAERMIRVIKRFNTQIGSYTDAENNPLPIDCFVLYITINPKSVGKAVKHLLERYFDYFLTFSQADQDDSIWQKIKLIDTHVMTDIQSNNSKHSSFIDLDFDVVDKTRGGEYTREFVDSYLKNRAEYYIIETRGGFHILIKKESMSDFTRKNFYTGAKECESAGRKELGDSFEVIINKQGMVPLPGSLQGGFVVRFKTDI